MMQLTLTIQRQQGQSPATFQSYALEVVPQTTLLDCLTRIKAEQDGSLAYRKNCRNAICGSCALRVNDRPVLACKESIGSLQAWLESNGQTPGDRLTIKPLGNLPVIRDLVVDITAFWDDLAAMQPFLLPAKTLPEREFSQSPRERQALTQTANCILCGACYSDCDAKGKNQNFLGPHALAKVHRYLLDSRDQASQSRLEQQNQGKSGVWGCNGCRMCNLSCPMEVAPMTQIEAIKVRLFDLLDPL